MKNNITKAVYGDGTVAKSFAGLKALVTDAGTGIVGGIDSGTWMFWKNQFQSVASATGLQYPALKAGMNALWMKLVRGTEHPDLIVADGEIYATYESGLQENQRYADAKLGALGFETLKYKQRADRLRRRRHRHLDRRATCLNTKYLKFEIYRAAISKRSTCPTSARHGRCHQAHRLHGRADAVQPRDAGPHRADRHLSTRPPGVPRRALGGGGATPCAPPPASSTEAKEHDMSDNIALIRFVTGWVEDGVAEDGLPRYRETVKIIKTRAAADRRSTDRGDRGGFRGLRRAPTRCSRRSRRRASSAGRRRRLPAGAVAGGRRRRAEDAVGAATSSPSSSSPSCADAATTTMPGEIRELAERAKQMIALAKEIGQFEADDPRAGRPDRGAAASRSTSCAPPSRRSDAHDRLR